MCVGVCSWIVFVVDLVVQRRIDPQYLRRRDGRIDSVIVLLTFRNPGFATIGDAFWWWIVTLTGGLPLSLTLV